MLTNRVILILFLGLLFPSDLFGARGVVVDRPIQLRKSPSLDAEKIPGRLPLGTTVDLLQTSEKITKISGFEGHWVEVQADSQLKGWMFDRFLKREGESDASTYVQTVVDNLYIYRPGIPKRLESLKNVPPEKIFNKLESIPSDHLNYIGYHLLAQGDRQVVPVIIEFMNPAFKTKNSKDPNYIYHWTLLQKLIGDEFVMNSSKSTSDWYTSYKTWWEKKGSTFELTVADIELLSLFTTIKYNESRTYRRDW